MGLRWYVNPNLLLVAVPVPAPHPDHFEAAGAVPAYRHVAAATVTSLAEVASQVAAPPPRRHPQTHLAASEAAVCFRSGVEDSLEHYYLARDLE